MGCTTRSPRRELAQRVSGGIEVTLYWSSGEGTTVEVRHAVTEERIAFPVAPRRALDAYYHPFAHLGVRVLEPALSGAS
jgi:hypothetical protein